SRGAPRSPQRLGSGKAVALLDLRNGSEAAKPWRSSISAMARKRQSRGAPRSPQWLGSGKAVALLDLRNGRSVAGGTRDAPRSPSSGRREQAVAVFPGDLLGHVGRQL